MASKLEETSQVMAQIAETLQKNLPVEEQKTLAEAMEAFKNKMNPPKATDTIKMNYSLVKGFEFWKRDRTGYELNCQPWEGILWDHLLNFMQKEKDPERFDYAKFVNRRVKIYTDSEFLLLSHFCGRTGDTDEYLKTLAESSCLTKDETFKLVIDTIRRRHFNLFIQINLHPMDWTFDTVEILTILAQIVRIDDEKEKEGYLNRLFNYFICPRIRLDGPCHRVVRILKALNDPRFNKYL
jgi:hypothetical protein